MSLNFFIMSKVHIAATLYVHISQKYIVIEDLHDLYLSPYIIGIFKSQKMRWAEHVARMGEGRAE